MNAAVAESEQRGQNQEQELQTVITELQSQLDELQAEEKKAGSGDDCHSNPEIDRMRKEVQETKEINKKLRDLLQVHAHTHTRTNIFKNHIYTLSKVFLCDE